jgi:hypothetical protein
MSPLGRFKLAAFKSEFIFIRFIVNRRKNYNENVFEVEAAFVHFVLCLIFVFLYLFFMWTKKGSVVSASTSNLACFIILRMAKILA